MLPLPVLSSMAPEAVWVLWFVAHMSHLVLLETKSNCWWWGYSSSVTVLRCGSTAASESKGLLPHSFTRKE